MNRKLAIVTAVLLSICCLIVLLPGAAIAQGSEADDAFAPVPFAQRARLAGRLKLLIDYQIKQDWARQYDLFSALRRRAEGKTDFISLSRKEIAKGWKWPLMSFTPKWTVESKMEHKSNQWFIGGCAKLKKKDAVAFENAGVEVSWERNDWFFSEVQMLSETEPGKCGQSKEIIVSLIENE